MTEPVARLSAALRDRYTIERELGAGGMATVYLAHDLKHDRKVALKVLKPELAAVVGPQRFLAEIRTTANLQHPHILPLFDSGEASGFLFFVMPYVEGQSLRDRLDREKQLPVDEAVRIAMEVADALGHAHAHGVVHRDIKPGNILLRDGHVQVADFGIALAVQRAGGTRLTETGLSVGTPHYMSPEQGSGDSQLDGRSDLYSLGCVLYEMLTGEPPHVGPTAQAILSKILTEEPRPVAELRQLTPANVATAIKTALRRLPADRHASARDFADALKPRGRAAVLEPFPLSSSIRRRRKVAAVSAVLATTLAAVAAWAWLGPPGSRSSSRVEFLPIELREPHRAFFAWGPGVSLSPMGDRLAYMGAGRWWWLLDLTDPDGAQELGIFGNHVRFSPSGDSIAHTTSAWLQQIHVVDLTTGRSAFLTDSAQGQLNWAKDGWIYYKDQLNGLRRVRVVDGMLETLVRPGPEDDWHAVNPAPLPNGKGLLYTRVPRRPRSPAKSEIVALDFGTRQSKVLESGVEAEVTASGHLLITRIDGSLLAARFDQENMEILGTPVLVLEQMETRELWEVGGAYSIDNEGTLLYVQRGEVQEDTVFLAGREGQVLRVLPTWGGVLYDPAANLDFSEADGRLAAAVHRGLTAPNILVRSAETSEPRILSFGEVLDVYPRFIPRTQDLAFVSPREGHNWDLYRVPFDGARPPELLLDRPGDIRFPRFTADGRWVVFCEASPTGERNVMAHRLGADSATLWLVASDAQECYPDVSPDLRWLAYESDETGRSEIHVRPFEEGSTTRWQVSDDGGSTPRWGTTGRELFFVNSRHQLVAVPVLGTNSFSYGSPRVLFALGERTEWTGLTANDDREFLLVRVHREAPGRVILVRNFLELLQQRVGG